MDAIELTIQDHRTAEDLFSRFEQSSDPSERRGLMDEIITELSVHAAIEEEVMYPVMRELPGGDDLVSEAIEEHVEAKVALAVLGRLDAGDPRFDEKAEELIGDVRHHVEEEESDLLPRLRDALGADRLDALGNEMADAKARAPQRPSAEDLTEATVDQLFEAAQLLDLSGRSDMNKEQMAKELVTA